MTWSLEEVTQRISCNLCAQESGDLQTYYAHARLTHLLFPAPTIRAIGHAQHRQHSRDGHERQPKVQQDGRRGRRGAAKPKTAPTSRTKQDRRARGSTTVVVKPKADSKIEQQSLNKIMLKAILKTHQKMRDLSSTVWCTLLIKASRKTCGKRVRGHTRGSLVVWAYLDLIKAPQQRDNTGSTRRAQDFWT